MGWFLFGLIPGWIGWKTGLFVGEGGIKYFGIYFLFLIESVVSVGWANLTFKIFNSESVSFKDLWAGYRKYILKAICISAVSGAVILLALFNIHFYLFMNHQHTFMGILLAGSIFWISLFWVSAAIYQWPILFFQDPPLSKIFYKSFLIAFANGLVTFGLLVLFAFFLIFFTVLPFLWLVVGLVFFFSISCVALEKHLLKYKIIYGQQSIESFVERLHFEQKRGWRDFIRPWESG